MMEQVIRDMMEYADRKASENPLVTEEIAEFVGRIIEVLAQTCNAPEDWRNIGTMFAAEWNDGVFDYSSKEIFFEGLELSAYGADECFGAATFGDE